VQSLDKWLKAQKEDEGEVGGGGADDILSSRPLKLTISADGDVMVEIMSITNECRG